MVTVNIVTPLPINGKLVTSQSVLKVREGAGEKKKERKRKHRETMDSAFGFVRKSLITSEGAPRRFRRLRAHMRITPLNWCRLSWS